jgi:hypothetical protein
MDVAIPDLWLISQKGDGISGISGKASPDKGLAPLFTGIVAI